MTEEKKDLDGQIVATELEVQPTKVEEKEIQPVGQPQTAISLFGTTDPVQAIKQMKRIADAVKDIIVEQKLYTTISGKGYVHCEGWTTMGALLGVFPQIEKVQDLSINETGVKRYLANCVVKTLDGRTLTRAESECSNQEHKKNKWDDYALRSMAETRAISKALRIALSFLIKLAGYEPTPAEEVDAKYVNEEVLNGNGDVDEGLTDLYNQVPKSDNDTNKTLLIKRIRHLMTKLNMDEDYLNEKVHDGGSLGGLNEAQLSQIMMILKMKHYDGVTIKKIKFQS